MISTSINPLLVLATEIIFHSVLLNFPSLYPNYFSVTQASYSSSAKPIHTGWGPKDSIQLRYKWLKTMVYGRFVNQLITGGHHPVFLWIEWLPSGSHCHGRLGFFFVVTVIDIMADVPCHDSKMVLLEYCRLHNVLLVGCGISKLYHSELDSCSFG